MLLVDRYNNLERRNRFNCLCCGCVSKTVSKQTSKEGGADMKIPKNIKPLVLIGLLVSFTLILSAGCSHIVLVAPKLPEKVVTEKIPLDVGLYITNEFKNYKVSESRKGDTWNYTNLGEASTAQFRLGLSQIFRTVELINEKPPFSKPKDIILHAVIEPAIDKFDFNIPLTKFQVYPSRIHYKITVYDMSGKVIFTKSVEGIGDTKGSPGFDFAENPSKAASKAVEDGANKALESILASEEIKALLKK
jgi:hypothetical protein